MTIQCDFDGTIIVNNLGLLLREQFADSRWRAIEADYLAGRLTVEESNTVLHQTIEASNIAYERVLKALE